MIQYTLVSQQFNEEQIARCYDVYIFEDEEEILSAWWDAEEGQLYIEYEDEDGCVTTYEPNCFDEEDYAKLLYIITGKKEDN